MLVHVINKNFLFSIRIIQRFVISKFKFTLKVSNKNCKTEAILNKKLIRKYRKIDKSEWG